MNSTDPRFFYPVTPEQAYCRGFLQGMSNEGWAGTIHLLDTDPTPHNADLVVSWLKGWSKGRRFWIDEHPNQLETIS